MAYGQVKTCWKRLRKRENENYRFDQFIPDPLLKIPKKSPKYSKNYKTPLHFFSSQNSLGKTEKERK